MAKANRQNVGVVLLRVVHTLIPSLLVLTGLAFGQDQQVDHGAAWVGTVAKSVPLKNEDGKEVDPGREFGKHPVVIVFYRGVW